MTTVKQAAEKAINLGKQLQAIIDVGEVLDQIGNLEEAKREASDLKTQAEIDRFNAEVILKELNIEIVQAEQYLKQTKNEAVKTLDDVNIARSNLLGQARAESKDMVSVATEGANKLIKDAEDKVKILLEDQNKLEEENKELISSLEKARYEMKVLRERLGN